MTGPERPRRRTRFDPIDLEVRWNQLVTLVDEAAYAVRRTSMSKVVVEGADFGVLLYDRAGRLVASDFSIASKISTDSILARKVLEVFPPESLAPGDVVVTNNPWWIMGHLNDIGFVAPLYARGRLVGFAETMAHMADIGGCLSAQPRELYEEGLIVPPLKAVEGGRENETFFAMLEANVRVPQQVASDVRALITGCRVLEAKLAEFLDRHAMADLDDLASAILEHSETAMRRAIAETIPEGTYHGMSSVDGREGPIEIHAHVRSRGGEILVDFTGTAPQRDYGINSTLVYTYVWSTFTIKAVCLPGLANNAGTFAPMEVTAPEGTLVNPTFPAPVKMKPVTGHYIPAAILDALGDVVPVRMLAESGKKSLLYLAGRNAAGQPFSDLTFVNGGMAARATKDGLHGMSFPGNTSAMPIEVLESVTPIRVNHHRIRPDSGGAGRYRGGCGLDFEFRSVSHAPLTVQAEHGKLETAPKGLRGGRDGAAGATFRNGEPVPDKVPVTLRDGDVMRMLTPGSGGAYPPRERDRAAVRCDVADGLVTARAAARDYGFRGSAAPVRAARRKTDAGA